MYPFRPMNDAREKGITSILASISSLNTKSRNFLAKQGFQECGRFQKIGKKWGQDFDVIWMHAISAAEDVGMGFLSPYLQDGKTVVLLGSSGVGKSTLINALEGVERQKVGAIREDDS